MLSQTATYALQAMAFLAGRKDDGPILSQTISQEMKRPKNFLSKIMNRLVQEGLVHSIRGPGGGFVLAKDPSDISMRDVVSPFMKLNDYKQCFLSIKKCNGSCALHPRWKGIADQIESMLDQTTIDKVL